MLVRSMILGVTWSALALVPLRAPDLPEQRLPIYGGSGGTAFSRDCGAGKVASGLRYRAGLLVDALGLLCRPVNADGSLGAETSVSTLAGGGGGTSGALSCASGRVLVGATLTHGAYVSGVRPHCRTWDKNARSTSGDISIMSSVIGIANGTTHNQTDCELRAQPVAGIRGREASVVDALGFTCDEP